MKADYRPSMVATEGDLAFSKRDVWIYCVLPLFDYEFKDTPSRETMAPSLGDGLASLIQNGERALESHLVMTSAPFDHEKWMDSLKRRTQPQKPLEYWETISEQMRQVVGLRGFRTKRVFLGVRVGFRSEFRKESGGTFGPLEIINDLVSKTVGIPDKAISVEERTYWQDRAKDIRRIFQYGHLNAIPAVPDDLATLVKEVYYPSMPVPELSVIKNRNWAGGELHQLGSSQIFNMSKMLKIIQEDENGEQQAGYRAVLCFTRFPDEMEFPQTDPWMHYSSSLPFPATIYSRFSLIPSGQVRKELEKKKKDAMDQYTNAHGNPSQGVLEQFERAQALEHILSRDKRPWAWGRHRIVVTAPTEDELRKRILEVKDHYKDINIDVGWPKGDQLDLMFENQPADQVRNTAYYQRHELDVIAVGLPNGSGAVGDRVEGNGKGWIGPYIGLTTSRVREPVFVSLHSAINRDKPPGMIVSGAPGSGKTFFVSILSYLMALMGTWTVFIDPKGDAARSFPRVPGLEGKVNVVNLKEDGDGVLDPFKMSNDIGEQQLYAFETIKLFLNNRLAQGEEATLMEVIDFVVKRGNPTLNQVVEELKSRSDTESRSLYARLNVVRQLPFARLCFEEGKPGALERRISADDGFNIISLQGLDLPANNDHESYTTKNYLAVGIMYLVASFVENMMNNSVREKHKAVIIDEAWTITTTPQGASMIPRLARLGRSLNTALVLVSQNAGDFDGIRNNMSYKLAFGTRDKDEIDQILTIMDLDPKSRANRLTIMELNNGECLMQDPNQQISRVKIDAWKADWRYAFNTTPDEEEE